MPLDGPWVDELAQWPEVARLIAAENLKPRYYSASRRRDTLDLDYETKSNVNIKKVGLDVYTLPQNRPSVMMAAYRINSGRLNHWEAHRAPFPAELREALLDPEVEKWAFHAQFERVVTRRMLKIATPRKGWRCTAVLAYMHSFTGRLKDIGQQIGLPIEKQKLDTGDKLVNIFTVPQKPTKNPHQPHIWRNWITDPELWEEFCEYNQQDVITEEAIKQRLISFPILEDEWDFYELDQLINDRGLPLDWEFVNNVTWMADRRKSELVEEMQDITGLRNPNSPVQLLPWVQRKGYPFNDLQKETIEKVLTKNKEHALITEECRRALELRQWASKTSFSKADTARRVAGPGPRARFLYQFGGASRTNRFSGRTVQPQNLTRTPKMLDPEDGDEKLNIATDLIREGNYDGFDLFINEPMLAFTGTMRGMFRAPEGEEFTVCDYASVETAGLAWVAKCPRLLNLFFEGRDPYKDFGTLFYNKLYEEITRAERQICKPPMLGCGYRLSAGKILEDGTVTGLMKYASDMGIPMTFEEAVRGVTVYREGYPEVPEFWYACERCVLYVLQTHKPIDLGFIRFEYQKPYLLIRLPSGRFIFYYKPQLHRREISTGRMKWIISRGPALDGAPAGQRVEVPDTYMKTVFSYMGRKKNTNKWDRIEAHGGVTTENVVQALTRDILKVGLMRLDAVGFNLVGHSHDEGISLTRLGDNYFTLELKRAVMRAPIEWMPGFPLNAAGWQGAYYRK